MQPSAPPIAESLPLLDKINALESQLEVTEKPSSLAEQVDNLKRILDCEKKLTGQSLFQQVDENGDGKISIKGTLQKKQYFLYTLFFQNNVV